MQLTKTNDQSNATQYSYLVSVTMHRHKRD